MKKYIFNNNNYVVENDEGNIFDYEQLKELVTSYFDVYDYIFVDQAYNKFRLKGFCNKENKNFKKNNDINTLEEYITNYCAYKCKWLLLKKVS